MYGEEADLCLRARRFGACPAVTPKATIIHYGGASEQPELEKHVRLLAAKAELIKRHWSQPKRQIGLFVFSMLPLTRAAAFGLADPVFRTRRARLWWLIWQQRKRWQLGYGDHTVRICEFSRAKNSPAIRSIAGPIDKTAVVINPENAGAAIAKTPDNLSSSNRAPISDGSSEAS